jgi:ATP-dependent helicase/nuclease subunit A
VLRSPLFGFTDEDLFAIAWDRGPLSLREALQRKTGEREIFAAADVLLDKLAQDARSKTPFAFYAEILGAGRARHRFIARLGLEANDALDEFLNLAFDYERRETPSLQGFLAWLREARAEVKRDMEIARNEVRVMTVHGAKGLEAPIVILADTMTPPAGPRQPRLLTLAGNAMIWAGRKADDAPPVAAARQAALDEAGDEYRRLLYVAMTRAADRLIVCGAEGERKRPDGCWYDLVRVPLQPFLVEEKDGEENVLRYRTTAASPEPAPAAKAPEDAARREFPSWLREKAPAVAPRTVPLSPSAAFDEEIGHMAHAAASAADRQKALERGRIVHRLMQSLPDIATARRKDALERYLAGAATNFSPAERAEIAQHVFGILDDPRFAEVFAPGSRPEVPIVGRIARPGGDPVEIAGQVDRLIVSGDAVLIADYKTDRVVPRQLDAVQPYVTQLALYRAVLARLYPGKPVRAALIFTSGPILVEVPAAAMDAELGRVLTQSPNPKS